MSRTLLSEPCFFQPLLPGFEDDFLIPIAFSKYLNGQVCEKAMLRSRKGEKLWPVQINGRRFGDGWKKFVEDHGLKIGEFLVFRYKGDLIFNVMVFDRSTCEKEYAPPTALEDSTCGKKVKTGLEAKASPSIVQYPSCVKEEEIEIEEQNLPNDSTRGKQVKASSSIPQRAACEKGYPPFTAIEEDEIEIQEHNLPKDSSSGKEVKTRLAEKASSSTLEHPHCVIELSRDSFRKTELYVPRTFARKHGLYGRSCSMILQDEEGKCWPSKLKFRSSNGKTLIIDAWKSFRDAHKLKIGDSIIVELAKNGQIPVLKLTKVMKEVNDQNNSEAEKSHAATEASNLEKSQPENHEEVAKESGYSDRKSLKSKQPETPSEAKATSSIAQQPFFLAEITSYCCLKSRLYVPERFARLQFGNIKCCKVILIDREGRSWPANFRQKDSDDEAYIGDGWNEFQLANNLEEGDSFVFEFIEKAKTPALKMYEFKTNHNIGTNQATASSMEKPYFYIMVFASAFRNRQIRIPRNFAWDNGLATSRCPEITIKDEFGNSWQVKTKMNKFGEVFIRDGWIEFAQENGIKEGDVFMLELVKEEGKATLMNYYATKHEIDSNEDGVEEDVKHVNPIV